jgi:hypothetical protein
MAFQMFETRFLVAKATKKSYSCCIYLRDNVCDPIDSECINEYNLKNNRFQLIAFVAFILVLGLIFVASSIFSCLLRRKDKNEIQRNPHLRPKPIKSSNREVWSPGLSEEDVDETTSNKTLQNINMKANKQIKNITGTKT